MAHREWALGKVYMLICKSTSDLAQCAFGLGVYSDHWILETDIFTGSIYIAPANRAVETGAGRLGAAQPSVTTQPGLSCRERVILRLVITLKPRWTLIC